MTFQLSQQQIDDLTALRNADDFAGMYTEIYNITANPDANGAAVDPMVREWFRAAANANAGFGPTFENKNDPITLRLRRLFGVIGVVTLCALMLPNQAPAEDRAQFYIDKAIAHYLAFSQHVAGAIVTVDGIESVRSIRDHVQYSSVEDFKAANPNCCRFTQVAGEGFRPSLWQRVSKRFAGFVVIENHMVEFDEPGKTPMRATERWYSLNRAGEIIVIAGINGD